MPPRKKTAPAPATVVPFTEPGTALVERPPALEGEILDPAHVLTKDEARLLTKEINTRAIQLWLLVERAHTGRAWEALGYDSWKQYVSKELDMSESRSFQLLDQARVMRELAAAGADPSTVPPPPARVVQVIKNNLTEVRELAAKTLSEGGNLGDAIRQYAAEIDPNLASRPKGRPVTKNTVPCPCCAGSGRLTTREANAVRSVLGK